MKYLITIVCIFTLIQFTIAQNVNIVINTQKDKNSISPLIYGTNRNLNDDANLSSFRIGGNRLSGYNWESNASNAGEDWKNSSDNYLINNAGIPTGESNVPGKLFTWFHDRSIENNAYSLVTLQMAGYVSRDKNGDVNETEAAPSSRWDEVVFEKGSAFSMEPDLDDGKVYIDECVNFLVQTYGNAENGGVQAYALDNEPSLWVGTHPYIVDSPIGCTEFIERSVNLAKATKNVDPTCEIYGPSLFGFNAYTKFQNAPDWNTEKNGYNWFIDFYLDKMKQAETANGTRIIDVLDLHWYPEAHGDERIIAKTANTDKDKSARLQAPRTLWDPTYTEDSWIAQWNSKYLPIIPRIKESIEEYYPGTKLAFSEFCYGGDDDITGGIACADVLGIFGKHSVYSAFQWPLRENVDYLSSAYKIYRNYDGKGASYGDVSVFSQSDDNEKVSVHSAIESNNENKLHIILLNKSMDGATDCKVSLPENTELLSGEVWFFNESSADIQKGNDITDINDNSFSVTMPKLSAYHIILDIVTTPTAITEKETENNNIKVFPNPTQSTIHFTEIANSTVDKVEIFDCSGRLLQSVSTNMINDNTINLSNYNISSGFLLLKIHAKNSMTMQKIIYKSN